MGRRYSFLQIDVFTTEPFAGNPAAVVLDADDLTSAQMQEIAREMNLSETVFLLRPEASGADYRARIFTPASELPFAGHPTIAAAHAHLAREMAAGRARADDAAPGMRHRDRAGGAPRAGRSRLPGHDAGASRAAAGGDRDGRAGGASRAVTRRPCSTFRSRPSRRASPGSSCRSARRKPWQRSGPTSPAIEACCRSVRRRAASPSLRRGRSRQGSTSSCAVSRPATAWPRIP